VSVEGESTTTVSWSGLPTVVKAETTQHNNSANVGPPTTAGSAVPVTDLP
jgi:hypothetical protein